MQKSRFGAYERSESNDIEHRFLEGIISRLDLSRSCCF